MTELYWLMVQIFMMFSEGFYQFRQFYFVFVTKSKVYKYVFFSYCKFLVDTILKLRITNKLDNNSLMYSNINVITKQECNI